MARIGIDFDDVLIKTAALVVSVYNKHHNTTLTVDDWYDLSPEALIRYNASEPAEVVKRVMAIQGEDSFLVEPIDGAVEALHALKDAGHELIIITGRPESLRPQTIKNVQQYFGDLFSSETVRFVDHFNHDISGKRITKGDVATELKLDYFIDDVVSHANIVAGVGVKTFLLDMDYKWSKQLADPRVVHVQGWPEIVELIDGQAGTN